MGGWLILAVPLAFLQLTMSGLLAWGTTDNGHYKAPRYQLIANGILGLFAATQLAALIGEGC